MEDNSFERYIFLARGELNLINIMHDWIKFTESFFTECNLTPDYIAVGGDSFKGTKVMSYKRNIIKIVDKIKEGSIIDSMAIYAVPSKYTYIEHDWAAQFVIVSLMEIEFVLLGLPKEYERVFTQDFFLAKLDRFIQPTYSETLIMDIRKGIMGYGWNFAKMR